MPSYVFTYRQPTGQALDLAAADAGVKWFDDISEHITAALISSDYSVMFYGVLEFMEYYF